MYVTSVAKLLINHFINVIYAAQGEQQRNGVAKRRLRDSN